jgi:K+-transporting ATPase KdpF subunit
LAGSFGSQKSSSADEPVMANYALALLLVLLVVYLFYAVIYPEKF